MFLTFLLVLLALGLIAWLISQVRQLRGAVEKLATRLATLERTKESTLAAPEKVSIPPSPLLVPRPDKEPPTASVERPGPVALPPPAPAAPFNWEAFMGVKLFAWLGGLALFLGIVFLVKYSFENNLITPFGRVVIGGLIGAGLIAGGWWLGRGRYRVPAQSLCATGLVILYADLFAAHSFYGLISLTTAFFAMAAVTLCSLFLAVNLRAQVIVVLGLLGGFLTPALLPSGSDNAPALFLYLALLDLGVAAVALRQRWTYLVLMAALGTVATQLGWAAQFFDASKGPRALWVFLGFEALFLALYFLHRRRTGPDGWMAAAAGLAGFVALGFCFWLSAWPAVARQPLYFFSFLFLADAGLLALTALGRAHRGFALGAGTVSFLLIGEWIGLFAPAAALWAPLGAIGIFALVHTAATPGSVWRPGVLPLTVSGLVAPFLLLSFLVGRVAVWNPSPVFALALVLALILIGAALVRRADWLGLPALAGVALVALTWQAVRFSEAQAGVLLGWHALFLVLWVVFPFCAAEKEKAWAWATSALGQALQFWVVYRTVARAFPNEWMGLLPALFLVPAGIQLFVLLRFYRAVPASGEARLAWQGGVFLLFVSLIFPLQFEREWITLGWALEGVALLWLFRRVPHPGLRVVGMLLLGAAFVRLALNPAVFEYHRRSGTRIWNWYLYAYGLTSFCLFAGARLQRGADRERQPRLGRALLASLGTILLFLLLNLEIADYFSIGPTLTFSFSGNFARDMTYSIAWALFALGLILAGMRLKQRAARYAGVGLLGVTLLKLFLHDLNDLDELYRIGAFVSVAVILIAASFIYQRFLVPERVAK